MQNGSINGSYDGSVVIAARMETDDIRAGAAEIAKILAELRKNAQREFSLVRVSAVSESRNASVQAAGAARQMMQATASAVRSGQGLLIGAVRDVMHHALDTMREQAARFSSIGTQMMAGVSAGIYSASSGVYAAARQTASQALAAMKDELGIQSPSRVMRDEVGMQIGYGLAQGMQRSIPHVTEAANRLSAAAVGTDTEQTVYGASRFLRGNAAVSGNGPGGQLQSLAMQIRNHMISAEGQNGVKHPDRNTGNTTIVFTKPVQTPYAHAKAVRETMEELLYGGV
ncbi:MAG: hypothetical protein ACI3XM_10620 [Eubacteriales bacterium]